MLKELGFTKEAGVMGKFPKGLSKYLHKADKAKETIKKAPLFGFKTGLGVGIVGTMGANAFFGDKKRNSPYYPY